MSTLLNNKHLYALLLFIFIAQYSYSQQRPQQSLYVVNSYLYNPAVGGIERFMDARLGYRSQWQQIKGAPTTSYFSMHAPFGRKKRKNYFVNPPNPKDRNTNRDDHTTSGITQHHSVGGAVIMDQTGNFQRYQVDVSYGYHLPLTKKYTLSMGVSGGVISNSINFETIKLADSEDPLITSYSGNIYPDLDLGAWIYSPKFFLGLSGKQLIPYSFTYFKNGSGGQIIEPSYFLITGYRFYASLTSMQIIPSLMVRYNKSAPLAVDGSMKFIYDQRLWGGFAIRSDDAISLFLGMAINTNFDFSYSYDYGYSKNIVGFGSGTHEFVLGIRIKNKAKVLCPQQLW